MSGRPNGGSIVRVSVVAVVVTVALAVSRSPGAEYRFSTVVPNFAPRLTPASVNVGGAVAFAVFRDDGTSGVYAGGGGGIVAIAQSLNDGSGFQGTLTDRAFGDFPVVNSAGLVAFQGRTAQAVGVYVGSGGAPSRVAPAGDLVAASAPAMNGGGTLAYISGRGPGDYGIFASAGGLTTQLVSNRDGFDYFSRPAIDDAGTVAFVAGDTLRGPFGLYAAPAAGGALTRLLDNSGDFRGFGAPAMAPDGRIAFTAGLRDGTLGLFSYSNGTVTRVADTSGPFASFGHYAINSAGVVVFAATLDDGGGGVFSGPDPVGDLVVGPGMRLSGETVGRVEYFGALNDAGQVAFAYNRFAGGGSNSGVALATPVPEASAGGVVIGACLLLRTRRRRR
jgi:hypothetical protein